MKQSTSHTFITFELHIINTHRDRRSSALPDNSISLRVVVVVALSSRLPNSRNSRFRAYLAVTTRLYPTPIGCPISRPGARGKKCRHFSATRYVRWHIQPRGRRSFGSPLAAGVRTSRLPSHLPFGTYR